MQHYTYSSFSPPPPPGFLASYSCPMYERMYSAMVIHLAQLSLTPYATHPLDALIHR